jgi:hypothetical protein
MNKDPNLGRDMEVPKSIEPFVANCPRPLPGEEGLVKAQAGFAQVE